MTAIIERRNKMSYKFYPEEFTISTNGTGGDLLDCTLEGSLTVDYRTDREFEPLWWERELIVKQQHPTISSNTLSLVEKVIINPPATIVIWKDGHKEVVKCSKDEDFNPEVGVAMCFMKRIFESRNQFTKLVDGAWNEYKKQFQKDIEKHVSSYEFHEDPLERRLCLYQSAVTNRLYFDERRNDPHDIWYGEVESFEDAIFLAETKGWHKDGVPYGSRLVHRDKIGTERTENIYSLKQDYDRKLSKLKSAQIKQGL